MSRWLASLDARKIRATPLGVRGHNLAVTPAGGAVPFDLSDDEKTLVHAWLAPRSSRMRWSLLRSQAERVTLADDLLRRLVECGWCEVELQPTGAEAIPEPVWVIWRDMYRLRALASEARPREPVPPVAVWRGWQPASPMLAGLAESLCAGQPGVPLERRLKIAQALDAWITAERQGSVRQFSRFALGRERAFTEADRHWLAVAGVDLGAAGVSDAAPQLYLSGPVTLQCADGSVLPASLLRGGLALRPEVLAGMRQMLGTVRAVRVVEGAPVFEQLVAEGLPMLLLRLDGRPSLAWRRAAERLFRLAAAPVQVVCAASPVGIRTALDAGEVAATAGCSWQPWRMEVEAVALAQGGSPLDEIDRAALAALQRATLPAPLARLAENIAEAGHKLDVESLFPTPED
ncbi:hypothetical protein Ga0061063_0661 [Gulbenkiania indica]|uniref:DUF2399 domain-containing protein n=1 Tax=Gulbenkiania indica TaxID=375574 RepID=A0A0K6GSV7_9NEIS|nr:hypothetical protein [Gulbenkiania indica]CUA81815.1 hypothetical protein Ga0061063_0661 [Gulbenkiania indica]